MGNQFYGGGFFLSGLVSFLPAFFVTAAIVISVVRKVTQASSAEKKRPGSRAAAERGRPRDFKRPGMDVHIRRESTAQPRFTAKPDPRDSFEWNTYNKEEHKSCCNGDPWDTSPVKRGKKRSGDDPWD